MKHLQLFEAFVASQKLNEASGFIDISAGNAYRAYMEEYAWKFSKTRSEKELSFMKSLECAKTPNKAFKGQLKEVEKMISWHEREIKKQGIEIKKRIIDFKEFKKDPNFKEAMDMVEELSQNIGINGAGKPSKIKYRYDYEWKTWDLTPSDKLACDEFIADIFKEWEAESAKAEKMDAKFWKYEATL
tara:strand:- start:1251 stop:1811 length:561 start_codon:yes stop_codon:yes gene_type:complete